MTKKNKIEYFCVICDKVIPKERLEALHMLGTPRTRWTHVHCSTETRKKGEYMDLPGASELMIVDKLYNDSVRDVLGHADREDLNSPEEPENEETK